MFIYTHKYAYAFNNKSNQRVLLKTRTGNRTAQGQKARPWLKPLGHRKVIICPNAALGSSFNRECALCSA